MNLIILSNTFNTFTWRYGDTGNRIENVDKNL